ncbi:hypothetical protein [Methanosarcina sp.]|uniref:hypothetical protein n=1 Tax=Methanosarcina sp. TaxID=2213 RepID=UPI0029887142|nr:hypothetical protein [Methanosarcina sp.]MDW5549486.1 hypothetical protein [Methanosarcina sp.]MDW5553520.1 hypothetical protein [Methanosarcina sp.]
MGYTSHRENVKADGSKKVTVWDNIRLKTLEEIKKDSEQNKTKLMKIRKISLYLIFV